NVARSVRAEIRSARGELAAALEDAETGLRVARAASDPQAIGPSLVTLARVLLLDGRKAEATALVGELLALEAEQGGFPHFVWIVDSAWLGRDTGRLDT